MNEEDPLAEYRAAVTRIDDAVARASAAAGDALACARGCHACCVDGLTVLPVEAEALAAHLEDNPLLGRLQGEGCAFLDPEGAGPTYAARPVLCRTHGLALRMHGAADGNALRKRALRVLSDDVSSCELNYVQRAPAAPEVLDAERILALLVTVDRRFRVRAGIDDDPALRIALRSLADG